MSIEEALDDAESHGQRCEVGFLSIDWKNRKFCVQGLCGDEDEGNNLTVRQVLSELMAPKPPDVQCYALALWDDNHQLSLLDLPLFLSEVLGVDA